MPAKQVLRSTRAQLGVENHGVNVGACLENRESCEHVIMESWTNVGG
jgi:hypothetical protein